MIAGIALFVVLCMITFFNWQFDETYDKMLQTEYSIKFNTAHDWYRQYCRNITHTRDMLELIGNLSGTCNATFTRLEMSQQTIAPKALRNALVAYHGVNRTQWIDAYQEFRVDQQKFIHYGTNVMVIALVIFIYYMTMIQYNINRDGLKKRRGALASLASPRAPPPLQHDSVFVDEEVEPDRGLRRRQPAVYTDVPLVPAQSHNHAAVRSYSDITA